ncbi:MAG TPA: HD domain-containing protein [Candidatus Methylomirabilis sp.]|nr:HD domain-containing protein [Candidatus Methylomirabilis sp.]
MDRPAVIQQTHDHVRLALEGEGTGHDWWHIERVRALALRIGAEEGADLFIVELGALLHDIADWKFHDDEHAGPRATREWLSSLNADQAVVDHVCDIVRGISFKGAGVATNMETLEGRVVQDADRLDALGAIGIARAFAYGGSKNRPLHDPDVVPTLHATFDAYRRDQGTTINHFYEKLLLLKDRMNTRVGKRLAEERHRYMEEYLERFFREWKGVE